MLSPDDIPSRWPRGPGLHLCNHSTPRPDVRFATVRYRRLLPLAVAGAVMAAACGGASKSDVFAKLEATEIEAEQVVTAAVGADSLGGWERSEHDGDLLLCTQCRQTISQMRLNGVFGPGRDLMGSFTAAAEELGGSVSPLGPEGLRIQLGADLYQIEIRWDGTSVVAWIITPSYEPTSTAPNSLG